MTKKHYKGINIYYNGYITFKKIDDCGNIHSANPLHLLINQASGYIQEKNGNKFLIFDNSVNENRDLLKKYADVWDGIKNKIKTINGGKENDYGKDYMKIEFNSDDNLPLNKPLKFDAMTIIIRSVFKEDGKLYPQVFLRWRFVWIVKMLQYRKFDVSEGIYINKQLHQNNVCFVIIGTLKMLNLNSNLMFVTNITMYWWLLMN